MSGADETERTPVRKDETPKPDVPARGQFCERHFSWLCQAGQGKCQRGDDYQPGPRPRPAREGS